MKTVKDVFNQYKDDYTTKEGGFKNVNIRVVGDVSGELYSWDERISNNLLKAKVVDIDEEEIQGRNTLIIYIQEINSGDKNTDKQMVQDLKPYVSGKIDDEGPHYVMWVHNDGDLLSVIKIANSYSVDIGVNKHTYSGSDYFYDGSKFDPFQVWVEKPSTCSPDVDVYYMPTITLNSRETMPIDEFLYNNLIDNFINESINLNESTQTLYKYETKFHLTNPVNDFDVARNYLLQDDMTKYLWGSIDWTKGLVEKIEWDLTDVQEGLIVLYSNSELFDDELNEISEWVRGQCSDGLGEGFEQQDFACYVYPQQDEDDYEDPTDGEMCSFDYLTNSYKFEFVGKYKN